jgi:hypothetical protein
MDMKNNDNEQYLISDGRLYVQGLDYQQLIEHINSFALEESGNGLDYCATIHELHTNEDYLVTFHGRMPLEALTDLVWELQNCGNDKQTVIAYTNCNRYGLPANAMFCMNEKISEHEAIAVDNQGHVYIIDDESESLNYKLTNKTTRYTSCPMRRTVEKESITVTASKPGLIRSLKFKFRALVGAYRSPAVDDGDEPRWCHSFQLAFWIAFFASMGLSQWMKLPKLFYFLDDFLFDSVPGVILIFAFIGLCFFLKGKGYIKLGPFTILPMIAFPFVLCILANYYITPVQRERVAIITDKTIDGDNTRAWVEWKYTDDNSTFVMSDDKIHDPLQVGDTCIVDWRQGVLGWPVVRGIVKK